jgi:hypothetical protein
LSKLTKQKREELKSLVVDATIRKLTVKETSVLVLEKLGVPISVDHIRHLKVDIKRDCAKELLSLQKDRDYYLQRMFFDRIAEFEYQQKVLHGVIDANKNNPDVQIKAINALHNITVNMTRLYQSLPVSIFYIPSAYGNNNLQQPKSEPDFGDEQEGPKPIFDENDIP